MSDSTNMWMGNEPDWKSLTELRDLLVGNRPVLDMKQYVRASKPSEDSNWCATSCCVAGYGILNKIGPYPEIFDSFENMLQHESFPHFTSIGITYAEKLLNGTELGAGILGTAFDWLFDGHHSNDVDGAIYRLNYFIEHKSPPAWFSLNSSVIVDHHTSMSMQELLNKYSGVTVFTKADTDCICIAGIRSTEPSIDYHSRGDLVLFYQYHITDPTDECNLTLVLNDLLSTKL